MLVRFNDVSEVDIDLFLIILSCFYYIQFQVVESSSTVIQDPIGSSTQTANIIIDHTWESIASTMNYELYACSVY